MSEGAPCLRTQSVTKKIVGRSCKHKMIADTQLFTNNCRDAVVMAVASCVLVTVGTTLYYELFLKRLTVDIGVHLQYVYPIVCAVVSALIEMRAIGNTLKISIYWPILIALYYVGALYTPPSLMQGLNWNEFLASACGYGAVVLPIVVFAAYWKVKSKRS